MNCLNFQELSLGIELGSTRIKGVLVDKKGSCLATGSYNWENKLVDGIWTYDLDDVWKGLRVCYKNLAESFKAKFGTPLTEIGSIGISGMMHGYLPFDKDEKLLVPFRTWRNTMTLKSSSILTDLFQFNIPQRWSIAHLYQAILNNENHVKDIDYLTTLSGYVHWRLTGQKVIGIGEASGMFPIDSSINNYNKDYLSKFDELVSKYNYNWKIEKLLPKVLVAGEFGGNLTEEGAKLLDETGTLKSGIKMCAPEGDAGTGMVATNSVEKGTGNISAGTSIFGMVVMEKELSKLYEKIDMVTTPDGSPVAMIHCNNCTSDINDWVSLFEECLNCFGVTLDKGTIFEKLYNEASLGDKDCGGLMAYNFLSGEHIAELEEGRPLFVRTPNSKMTLKNFMRTHIYSAFAVLKNGFDILIKDEKTKITEITGHGGIFKTKDVAQQILANAINTPISVMETAGEGGAWGIALLASYMINKESDMTISTFLNKFIFINCEKNVLYPDKSSFEEYENYIKRYNKGLEIERAAVENL